LSWLIEASGSLPSRKRFWAPFYSNRGRCLPPKGGRLGSTEAPLSPPQKSDAPGARWTPLVQRRAGCAPACCECLAGAPSRLGVAAILPHPGQRPARPAKAPEAKALPRFSRGSEARRRAGRALPWAGSQPPPGRRSRAATPPPHPHRGRAGLRGATDNALLDRPYLIGPSGPWLGPGPGIGRFRGGGGGGPSSWTIGPRRMRS